MKNEKMNLSGFFRENVIKPGNIKYVVSNRFLDENKKPIEWELKPITSKDDEDLRKRAMQKLRPQNGQYEFDQNKYVSLLAAACTVYPDLNDANLQDSYGVMGAEELLKIMLLPGEYADYLGKIQEICGFNKNMNDLVKEAKN